MTVYHWFAVCVVVTLAAGICVADLYNRRRPARPVTQARYDRLWIVRHRERGEG